MSSLADVVVVVPARDEAELLGRCLRGLRRARAALAERHPGVRSSTLVVLDRCRDGSAVVAARHDCTVLEVDLGSVGAVRAAGVLRARQVTDADPRRVWVASTDADSAVPEDWLVQHAEAAASGAGLVLGPVRPVGPGLSTDSLHAWRARDGALAGHQRVHGANLGVRLADLDRAGGFRPVPEHEDVLLVADLRRLGVAERTGPAVLTSGRLAGRSPGGFAGYLRGLAAQDSADDVPPAM